MEKARLCLLLTFCYGSFLIRRCSAGQLHREFVYPNFTASNQLYLDNSGAFLASANSTFQASVCNPGKQQSWFYLCITHQPSGVLIWSANRDRPISSTDAVTLSTAGLFISVPGAGPGSSSPVWSTPKLPRAVAALRLLETGNLVLLDASNATLWQSFDHPTDVLVAGQRLPAGSALTSSVSDSDLSEGDYRLEVTARDVLLRWKRYQQYWSMWSDLRFFPNSNAPATYLEVNATGVYLSSASGYIFATALPPTARFRIAKLESRYGQLVIKEINSQGPGVGGDGNSSFVAPESNCELPQICKSLGLCTPGVDDASSSCSCPSGFTSKSDYSGCVPTDGSVLPPPSSLCSAPSGAGNSSSTPAASSGVSYAPLGNKIGYFANKFASPALIGVDFAACRTSCSANCSCLGFYYRNASKSCYLLERELGSLFAQAQESSSASGYIKIHIAHPSPGSSKGGNKSLSGSMALPIVLPSVALFLLVVVLLLLWRRRRQPRSSLETWTKESSTAGGDWRKKSWPTNQQERNGGDDDEEEEEGSYYSILGLPTRFTYEELEAVTQGFRERIGSGGFGEVYKGVLPDESAVAVKKITNMGVQGKKEFCTEIAVIGNIHHVNLVKLRGFCVQGSRRLLVYEYMNRGSLDRSLFAAPGRPVLEWQERVDIAVGSARGLAYLHAGCDQKIIHCDVKPENILLHDHNGVKISDFGLAKLLSPDQSSWMTTMRGTRGYLAPEWLTNTAISDRTDVYSFGMVLLEIVRGRKNYAAVTASSSPLALAVETPHSVSMSGQETNANSNATEDGDDEECSLTNSTVRRSSATNAASPSAVESYFPLVALEKHEEGRYEELVDPRLQGRVSREEVARVVKVALCCLHEDPGRRPPMSMVAGMLDGTVTVLEPRPDLLRFLRFYGRATTEPPSTTGGNASVARSTSSSNSDKGVHYSYLSSQQVSGPR